jgi:Flp pilus assembly protein TadD
VQNWAGVAEDLSVLLARKPEPALHVFRARARIALKDLFGAEADFTEAIRLRPQYGEALGMRGLLREQLGNRDGALADAAAGLETDLPEERKDALRRLIERLK